MDWCCRRGKDWNGVDLIGNEGYGLAVTARLGVERMGLVRPGEVRNGR